MPALDYLTVDTLDGDGYLDVMTAGTNLPRRLPKAVVRAGLEPALTATQPGDLGTMAYATGAAQVSRTVALANMAAIEARLATLEAQQ